MCTGRVDLSFVLRAFSKGADGVFIIGCRLNECSYITHGNFHALGMVHLSKKIMEHIGLNPARLMIEFMSGGEGILFAEVMNDIGKKVRELGPLGQSEGIDETALKAKLDKLAITQIMLLLREGPLPTGKISEILGMTPSEVSRHMSSSSRQGLVRYDESRKRFALA
jgi:coenzyme F420-reducing hydrogenase delta subunit